MNKFKKCKTCGSQIAKSANSCPNCGAKQDQGVYAVCVLIIILAIVSCIFVVLKALPEIEQTTQIPSNTSTSKAVGISETLSTENFDFSIKSAYTCQNLKNTLGMEYTAESGNEYLVIIFDAKNTSNDTKNVMNMNFNSYIDNNKVSAQSIVGEIDGFMPLMGATSSQMTFTGYTVWELPIGWNQMQFSYIDALSGEDSEKHFLIYKNEI